MRFDRRLITHFEWVLPLLALSVCGLGAATVYSATHVPGTAGFSPLALRQIMWLAGGGVAMLAVLAFDYRRLERSAFVLYALVLVGVLVVPVIGRVGGDRFGIVLANCPEEHVSIAAEKILSAVSHVPMMTASGPGNRQRE